MAFSHKVCLPIFLLFSLMAQAQIGLMLGGNFNKGNGWIIEDKNNTSSFELPGNGLFVGLNYEINLNKNRIAMVPSFQYSHYQNKVNDVGTLSNKLFQFQLNMQVYLLDIKGDCYCPTFSKKGNPLKKGLFITISPGVGYIENKIQGISSVEKNFSVTPGLGFGLGYEIGINERLTLTTHVNAIYFPVLKWPGLTYILSLPSSGNRNANTDTALQQIQSGITFKYQL
jgi:hypothetical protein